MSLFEDQRYLWRDTYFVLFDSARRPTLEMFWQRITRSGTRFELLPSVGIAADPIESLTLLAPDDRAGIDLVFRRGDEVIVDSLNLLEDLRAAMEVGRGSDVESKIRQADGRFDVLHFQRADAGAASVDPDDQVDPNAVLLVIEHLLRLTDGIAIDPQGGVVLQ